MQIIRQVEIEALTFTQYDNGISEIKYSESSKRAVEGFSHFVDMLIREAAPDGTIRLLSDLSDSGPQPLGYHYRHIDALNERYESQQRPLARFANVYKELTVSRKMVLEFMRSREMHGVQLEMFPQDQRNRAIMWLLSDGTNSG